jgi:hypothetical protein
MAVLTSTGVARTAVGLLSRSIVLPNTVTRVTRDDFPVGNGATITLRVPSAASARTQSSAGATITYDDVTETGVNVTLSHLYHAKRVTDQELTYSLVDFGAQITSVQVDAVARGAEDLIAAAMNALSSEVAFNLSATDADTIAKLLAARQALGAASVPSGDRYLAVSPDIATRLLSLTELRNAASSGDNSALRQATIGDLFGFTVVESNALTAGTAVAYHRNAFAFANVLPATPRGATDTATATFGGVGLRHIFQYQPDILSDASVVSTFAGAALVDGARVVKMTTATA